MQINGESFEVEAVFGRSVTIPDCFVFEPNKIGRGHGEAKLYLGTNEEITTFFDGEGFNATCFLLKTDLLNYMDAVKKEYMHPTQNYFKKDQFDVLWQDRVNSILTMPDAIEFTVSHQDQIAGPRGYINSKSPAYKLLRNIALPNITFLYIEKLKTPFDSTIYYWKLYADYELMGRIRKTAPLVYTYGSKTDDPVIAVADGGIPEYKTPGREGQNKYREQLLLQTSRCPITLISDERLLVASHIKPWVASDDDEKVDPYNGYMLSPLVDRLFDQGYITFTPDKRVILSNAISNYQWKYIGIKNNSFHEHILIDDKRLEYLDFHHKNVFKGLYEEI